MRGVWSGVESCVRVWVFVERLLDEPWSRYRARLRGGESHWREHLGWGPAEYLLALQVDAIQANTSVAAVAGSGKRPRKVRPLPRPTEVRALSQDERDMLELEGVVPGDEFLGGEV